MLTELATKTYPASKRSEIFEQMHESTNWFWIEHEEWHLPGTKEAHDWCGKWLTKGCLNVQAHKGTKCEGKGYVKTFQRLCYRADCEVCYKKWIAREANKATRRIEKYEDQSGKHAKHIIVSPPGWLYYKSKKELAKQSYQILKDIGCIGGTSIFHPFRYEKDLKQWYFSPHFHVIGFGWIENVVENYQKKWLGCQKQRCEGFYVCYFLLPIVSCRNQKTKSYVSMVWQSII